MAPSLAYSARHVSPLHCGALLFPSPQPALRVPDIGSRSPHPGPGTRRERPLMHAVCFRLDLNIDIL